MVMNSAFSHGRIWLGGLVVLMVCLTAGIGNAANLMNNASFEAGLSGVTRGGCFTLKKGNKVRTAKDGVFYASSKLPLIVFSGCEVDRLPSSVTFSLYMRSKDEKGKVRLALFGPSGRLGMSKYIDLTPDWKRYTLSAPMPNVPEGKDVTPKPVCIPVILNHFGMAVEFDALQLETSFKTDFKPRESIAVGCETGVPGNLFIGTRPVFEVPIANQTNAPKAVVMDLNVVDLFGTSMLRVEKNLDLKAQSVMRWKLESGLDVPYGVYTARVALRDANGVLIAEADRGFGFMRSWPPLSSEGQNRFGVHSKWGASIDAECTQQRWGLINVLGVGWVRIFMSWKQVEQKRGRYDWSFYDREIDTAVKNGKKVLVVFYNRTPDYAKGAGDGPGKLDLSRNMRDRLQFIRECAVRYADRVDAWELFNEPYIFYTRLRKNSSKQQDFVRDYQEYITAVASILKQHDPQAELIVNQLAARPGRDILEFIKIAGEMDWGGDSVDLSFHDYHTAQALGHEAQWYDAMFDRIRLDICNGGQCGFDTWQTEYAFSTDDQSTDADTIYGEHKLSSQRRLNEDEASSALVKAAVLRAVHGVKRDFYFLVGADQVYLNMLTLFRGRWDAPKGVAIAYSTTAHLLGDCRFIGEKTIADGSGAVFVMGSDKRQVAVLWRDGKTGHGQGVFRPMDGLVTVYDIYGNVLKEVKVGESSALPMDSSPLFVVYERPEASEFKLLDMIH